MQNIPPHTWVLHCPPWTLSVSVKLIKLHENSWKGKELDHIEYLYKPLLNINTCNRQVMMSQKLNWLNYGIGWHIQVFLPFIWANWLVHSLGKWYVRFRTGNWISTPNRIYYLYKSLPFTERSETGIKDGFEEMKKKKTNKHQDYLFRCYVHPGNFLLERPKKFRSLYITTRFSGNFCKW